LTTYAIAMHGQPAVALYEMLRPLFNLFNMLRLHETCDSV
jgi:hypothetical protein